jgi:hypothetical protein
VVFEPDIEFASPDGQHLKLDLARPKDGDGPFPAVLCIHGGGFRAGTRQGYDALRIRLAEEGYVAVTVDYRVAPNWGSNLLVALTFLSLVQALGSSGAFWLYAAVGVAAWLFSYFLVPETRGKSLEEIEAGWAATS